MIQLVAPETLAGNDNNNGAVNAADYTMWRHALGETPMLAGGGADGDLSGPIDAADLAAD